jgi:hypothetical protein
LLPEATAAGGSSAHLPTIKITLKKNGSSRRKKAKGSRHRQGFVGGKRRPDFRPERGDYAVGILPASNDVLGCKNPAFAAVGSFSTTTENQADAPSGSEPFCGHDTPSVGVSTRKDAQLAPSAMVKRKVNTRDNIASAFDPAVERARLQELDDTEVKRSRNDLFAFTRMMKQEVMDKGSTPSAFEPAEKKAPCDELDDTDV